MSELQKEIAALEKNTRHLQNIIDEIVDLKGLIDNCRGEVHACQGGERRLVSKLKSLIERYESMSTGGISQIKKQGFAEDRLRKYTCTTYNGEKVTGMRIDKFGGVSVITKNGVIEVCEVDEDDHSMYSLSADSLLLDIQHIDGIYVSKY